MSAFRRSGANEFGELTEFFESTELAELAEFGELTEFGEIAGFLVEYLRFLSAELTTPPKLVRLCGVSFYSTDHQAVRRLIR